MKESTAMQNLPPYLFARIEKKIEAARQQGLDVINLGIGDPDQPTPEHIIAALTRAVHDPPIISILVQWDCCAIGKRWPAGIKAVLEWSWIPVPR